METEDVNALEETLKWGEPSYLTKGGITLRMDWKDRALDRYEMYFNCNTSLVDTFKEVYGDVFTFEGNRVIVWQGSWQRWSSSPCQTPTEPSSTPSWSPQTSRRAGGVRWRRVPGN